MDEVDELIKSDNRVRFVKGNLICKSDIKEALRPEGCSRVTVYHLAALLSGNSEDNFDLGMKVNLYGTLDVMEEVRALGQE